MLLPRVTSPTTSTATPSPGTSSAMNHTSTYNTVSIIIAAVTLTVGLGLFYLFYWRKRPSNPEPRLCVSRAGVGSFVTGGARDRVERQRIMEQVRREQEERGHCAAEWAARRVEQRTRDGVSLPKYSRAPNSTQPNRPEMESVMAHVAIQVPPPAYDQTMARPPNPHRIHA